MLLHGPQGVAQSHLHVGVHGRTPSLAAFSPHHQRERMANQFCHPQFHRSLQLAGLALPLPVLRDSPPHLDRWFPHCLTGRLTLHLHTVQLELEENLMVRERATLRCGSSWRRRIWLTQRGGGSKGHVPLFW